MGVNYFWIWIYGMFSVYYVGYIILVYNYVFCCDRFAFIPCSSNSVQRYSATKTDKNKSSDLIIQPQINDVTEESNQRPTDSSEINPTVGVFGEHYLFWTQHICQLSSHRDGTIYNNQLYWKNNYDIDVTNREESK